MRPVLKQASGIAWCTILPRFLFGSSCHGGGGHGWSPVFWARKRPPRFASPGCTTTTGERCRPASDEERLDGPLLLPPRPLHSLADRENAAGPKRWPAEGGWGGGWKKGGGEGLGRRTGAGWLAPPPRDPRLPHLERLPCSEGQG